MTLAALFFTILVGGAAAGTASGRVPLPSADLVAGWLRWNDGRWCRDLIDACLDENGNDLFEIPEYKVSNLKCRRVPEERAICSFTSEQHGRTAPPERCNATFKQRRLDSGEPVWEFAFHPREGRLRLSPSPVLKCN